MTLSGARLSEWWNRLSVPARVLLIAVLCSLMCIPVAQRPVWFWGTAMFFSLFWFTCLRLCARLKWYRAAKWSMPLFASASFVYLRTNPFQPFLPSFWAMVFGFVAVEIATLAFLTLAFGAMSEAKG